MAGGVEMMGSWPAAVLWAYAAPLECLEPEITSTGAFLASPNANSPRDIKFNYSTIATTQRNSASNDLQTLT
jgi:hypothetical protein